MGQLRYRVYFTPLLDVDTKTYGDEIDVSDRVISDGVGSIKRSIDSSDYDIGVFVYSEVNIKGFNFDGYFNDETDSRSIFPETRDRCKVRVEFEEVEITRNSSGVITDTIVTSTITFRGIINEEATRLDDGADTITFKVLSRDSVLRTTQVSSGQITDSMDTTDALYSILNVPDITSVLSIDVSDINTDIVLDIDDGSFFDNKGVKDALNSILLATNSILLITDDSEIIIRTRVESTDIDILNLYGKSDPYGRENIIAITAYNSGKHRVFTSVKIGDTTEEHDQDFIDTFGYHQKEISTLDFITDAVTQATIATTLLNEFKVPKIEMNVQVATSVARGYDLMDRVSVSYPLRKKPDAGKFLPILGATVLGDSLMPLPNIYGSLMIPSRYGFKIIEIDENPKLFTSVLKLRQIGTTLSDGVFDGPHNSILGFAVLGDGVINGEGDSCADENPSVVGAAEIGCTELAV